MKKLNASLLILALGTGLVLAGCNQKPAEGELKNVNGSIVIEENDKEVTGTLVIKEPENTAVNGSLTITEGEAVSSDSKAEADANAALEEANKALESLQN